MERIFVSSCLLGERVRYHGGDALIDHPVLRRWHREGRLVPFCPEVTGGLPIPRPAAEIVTTPTGRRLLTGSGHDVTAAFERGAQAAIEACLAHRIRVAILKDGSPSCGSRSIYDGTFSGTRVAGSGLTAARLAAAGIVVFSEQEIDEAAAHLAALEANRPD